jgi:hypothetical protein
MCPLFIANAQAAKLIEPGEGLFYDPSPSAEPRCHARCCAWRATARCGGHADLAVSRRRHNHGRLTRSQDDDAAVRALPAKVG